MSEQMLHILAPSRYDDVAAIVGDEPALRKLKAAVDEALRSGCGGAYLSQSDGEGYSLAIVQVPDMYPVCTTYAGEVSPARSRRETVGVRAVPHFIDALRKAGAPVANNVAIRVTTNPAKA
jgi:hypothetical protein